VIPTFEDFIVPSLGGDITISDQLLIDVSGEGGGRIFIRNGQFIADNSLIKADTVGNKSGYGINIKVDDFSLNYTEITSDTFSEGYAGSISIDASNISLNVSRVKSDADDISTNNSLISSDTYAYGNANQVLVIAKNNITMEEGWIASGSIGAFDNVGNAAQVIIEANKLVVNNAGIYSETNTKGNAGKIVIKVNDLLIDDGGRLYTSTTSAGNAG